MKVDRFLEYGGGRWACRCGGEGGGWYQGIKLTPCLHGDGTQAHGVPKRMRMSGGTDSTRDRGSYRVARVAVGTGYTEGKCGDMGPGGIMYESSTRPGYIATSGTRVVMATDAHPGATAADAGVAQNPGNTEETWGNGMQGPLGKGL